MRTTPSRFRTFIAGPAGGPADPAGGGSDPLYDELSMLELRHPAVVRTITLLWGRPELNQYFAKISGGTDATLNLEPEAMAEAMLLAVLHQRVCPYSPARSVEELYGRDAGAGPWKPARPRR